MSSGTPAARGLSIWIFVFAFIGCAAAADDRAWIERSDRNTAMVFDTLGAFYPEWMSSLGIEKYDTHVNDATAGYVQRILDTLEREIRRLNAVKQGEGDRRVREDLDITIEALQRNMFSGLQALLEERNAPERRQHALGRLRAYAGMEPSTTPIADLARERAMERPNAKLLWPYRGEVEQQIGNCERYMKGIAELFRASPVKGWEAPQERLAAQVRDYCGWLKTTVL